MGSGGGPEVLRAIDREPASPGPGEVLMRVAVAGTRPGKLERLRPLGATPDDFTM